MELDKKSLKKMFPSLEKEMQSNDNRVSMNSVRTDSKTGEKATNKEKFTHYVPDVIDFIRRCDTEKQAEEIIDYLEKKGEIDGEYAHKLKTQLMQKGVRSFGAKKKEGYYFIHGQL